MNRRMDLFISSIHLVRDYATKEDGDVMILSTNSEEAGR